MKIGIMSMQRIINYGSFLQAYGLSNTIKNLGHDVEFVDFEIEPCVIKPEYHATNQKNTSSLSELEDFDKKFENEYLKELSITKRNVRPLLDTLVIGSDEVFNCLQSNPMVGYSTELFGKNNNADSIISYAASCGTTTLERLKEYHKDSEIANLLSKFKSISVRDNNSYNLVKDLTARIPEIHLDPVFIYNFDNDIIDKVNIKDYIIVYAYSYRFNEEESKAIIDFARKNNKKIVSIGTYQHCCDMYIPAHPLEVLAYFKHADYIITDTFHGSIFSIKANRPFATIIRESNKQKLSDLLDRLNLRTREVKSIDNLENILKAPIDYTDTNRIIAEETKKSIEYLKNNL